GDRIALSSPAGEISYDRLRGHADALAARLYAAGARPGDLVGILLPRGPDAVTAMLGTWQAGAAYVPLDPEYPSARLEFMVADSNTRVVVTDAAHADLLPGHVTAVLVGQPPAATENLTPVTPVAPRQDDPAYVVYTSGSTGTPKGVLVPHGALAARVDWMRSGYGIAADDQILQSASLSFDTHAEEIYPCLATGATLVLPAPETSLPEELAEHRLDAVTVLDLPTPYWHELVESPTAITWPAALRLLVLGADQVRPGALAAWREQVGDRVRVVNSYGPTETTVIATTADLGAADTLGRPPIGTPIGRTRTLVCDAYGNPVPPGVPGELYIGGDGVTHGYLGRPGATAGVFVPDPHGPPG
ncbi:amino acid adenylation domain-containing protein, partial [Streptomyces sp. SID3343]|uniref:amino acid adenylation domain-containing protein n=1 Tax=Streptomyces sp. SID3343 TaxID=2690260 RepID=UPI00136BB36B